MKQAGVLIIGLLLGSVVGAGSTFMALKPVSQSQFDELSGKVQVLETSLSQFDVIEESIQNVEDDLKVLQHRVNRDSSDLDELKAYSLMKMEIAVSSELLASGIVNDVFLWFSGDSDGDDWLRRSSEAVIKQTIESSIDSKIGKLVWYEYDIQYISEDRYYVYMIADIPLSIETGIPILGTVTFSRYQVVAKGTVNTSWDTVSEIEIT